jgi:hypothetical protein
MFPSVIHPADELVVAGLYPVYNVLPAPADKDEISLG